MRVLIVGAGAVGTAYAWALQKAGHDVIMHVRPKYAALTREGMVVFDLNSSTKTQPIRVVPAAVNTEPAELAAQALDAVIVTVSSPQLEGEWLGELLSATGDATVLALQPGLKDRERYLAHIPESRFVLGIITLIAYQAPLPGETRFSEPGIAVWVPPIAKMMLDGEPARTDALAAAFTQGGMPAKRGAGLAATVGYGSAMMNSHIVALELSGWSLAAVRGSAALKLALDAAREEFAIVQHRTGAPQPASRHLLHPIFAALASRIGPALIPMDLETYLKYHFTKVGDQSLQNLQNHLDAGAELGLPTQAIQALRAQLIATRAAVA